MKRYHFRIYVGPTEVERVADLLDRKGLIPTVLGTEHVHFVLPAKWEGAARQAVAEVVIPLGIRAAELLRVEEGT